MVMGQPKWKDIKNDRKRMHLLQTWIAGIQKYNILTKLFHLKNLLIALQDYEEWLFCGFIQRLK
jgi:hypothetical protein